ncbi:hypothetical protein [Cupriavidus sp. AcVe19-6a]|uniref:hypothetical protein n=1 Tax=Cupriavidus sp. AcVe19-6a TaxID=2821358 RepID=UPI001AE49A9C|nr:hypothetical protein [Cupriavidus sp. AcVe19-6a]MBP0637892.1 hypothetical protein [Cupriavidus sp. AcVe19-6a]
MNPQSPCQRGQAASRPQKTLLHRPRRAIALLRILGLCLNSVACAQVEAPQPATPVVVAVTPEQKFAPGYLEAVSTGYDNGVAWQEPEGIAPLRQPREARGPASGDAGAAVRPVSAKPPVR